MLHFTPFPPLRSSGCWHLLQRPSTNECTISHLLFHQTLTFSSPFNVAAIMGNHLAPVRLMISTPRVGCLLTAVVQESNWIARGQLEYCYRVTLTVALELGTGKTVVIVKIRVICDNIMQVHASLWCKGRGKSVRFSDKNVTGDAGAMAYGLLVMMQWESESRSIQLPNTTCPL